MARYLLDTNVLLDAAGPRPNPGLSSWLTEQSSLDLFISVLTLGEIRKGILLLADGKKRERLLHWLRAELTRQFTDRVLAVDEGVALSWGRIAAEGQTGGRRLPVVEGLMLATADVNGLTFVTRNERDCANRGVPVLDPWTDA